MKIRQLQNNRVGPLFNLSHLILSITFLGCLVSAGCKSNDTVDSEDVNEAKIHRTYKINFSGINSTLEFLAEFRVGGDSGTTVKLSDPAKVQLDGNTMEYAESSVAGSYYYWRTKGTSPGTSYRFTWTRGDGKVIEDIVKPAALLTVTSPADGETVSRGAGFNVTFDPAITANGESVYLYLSPNTADSLGKPGASDTTSTGNSLRLDPTEIDAVATGPVRFHISHRDKGRVSAGEELMEGAYDVSSDSDYYDLTLAD